MERALGLSESRLGSEMRKLTHAQEMLHEMMSQMQRQAEGMDKAQQVILQYLVSQQVPLAFAAYNQKTATSANQNLV